MQRLRHWLARSPLHVGPEVDLEALGSARLLHAHTVTLASSGRDALELRETGEYDVVSCDLMMPDLNGAELYERLRAARPGCEERIVFMTGGLFTERMKELVASCGKPLVQKPFDVEALRRVIAERGPRRSFANVSGGEQA